MTGDEVRRIRESLALTQAELAAWLGYSSESAICKLETGVNQVSGPVRRLMELLRDSQGRIMTIQWDRQKKA